MMYYCPPKFATILRDLPFVVIIKQFYIFEETEQYVQIDRNIIVSIISEYGKQKMCVAIYIKSKKQSKLTSPIFSHCQHRSYLCRPILFDFCISYDFVRMNLILITVHFINNTSCFLLGYKIKSSLCYLFHKKSMCLLFRNSIPPFLLRHISRNR